MHIESHKRAYEESMRSIRCSIQEGPDKNQRSIGFNCSAAAVDLLEIYLHQEGLLGLGATIKHDWFTSIRRAEEKVKLEFPKKKQVLGLIVKLEEKRNLLVYGKQQSRPFIEEYIELFNNIQETFEELGISLGRPS